MKPLDERVAIVTGAASGVGLGIAAVLAREGAKVALADIDLAAAEEAAAGLEGGAVAVPVDVTSRDSLQAMAASVLERWGRIDILAANAGVYPATELSELDDDALDRIIEVNIRGTAHAINACLPAMRDQGYGRIVLTSSITGPLVGAVGYGLYGASKAWMLGLMRSLALEVAADAITVNAVQPGNVWTPGFAALPKEWQERTVNSIPLGRLAEPEDVGWAVRFLASEEAGYITGSSIVLDGGQVLPESPAAPD